MLEVGFSEDLTTLLLDDLSDSYLKSVILRLKIYNNQNKSHIDIKKELENHDRLYSLVDYLFGRNNINTIIKKQINDIVEEETNDIVEEETNIMVIEKTNDDVLSDSASEEDNPFNLFLNQCIKKTNKEEHVISSKIAYTEFKKWYSLEYESEIIPKRKELTTFLNEKLTKSEKKNNWTNVMIK